MDRVGLFPTISQNRNNNKLTINFLLLMQILLMSNPFLPSTQILLTDNKFFHLFQGTNCGNRLCQFQTVTSNFGGSYIVDVNGAHITVASTPKSQQLLLGSNKCFYCKKANQHWCFKSHVIYALFFRGDNTSPSELS